MGWKGDQINRLDGWMDDEVERTGRKDEVKEGGDSRGGLEGRKN